MSDPQPPVGDPIEEPRGVDDVVGSAHEGLADAAAAGAGAASDSAEPASAADTAPAEERPTGGGAATAPSGSAPSGPGASEPARTGGAPTAEPDPWESPEAASLAYTPAAASSASAPDAPEPAAPEAAATEPVAAPPAAARAAEAAAVTASEPAAVAPAPEPAPAAVAPAAAPAPEAAAAAAATVAYPPTPQPIFVQAPESPRPRGNRGAAGAIGLLAAASFAVLFIAAWSLIGLFQGTLEAADYTDRLTALLSSWTLWTPVVFFFIGFWLLGAIVNRGRWGHWVIWGILVAVVAWAGFIAGQLMGAPFWMITASEGVKLIHERVFAPLAVCSFIIARELTIWFGAWAAARGKRVTAQNLEAQREYERTLEAGPQLVVP